MIDIVIGVNWRLRPDSAAGKLDGAVRDNLVGVHVGLRAGAGLEDDQRELLVELSVDHVLCGANDQIDLLAGQLAQLFVGERGAFLENAQSADHGAAPSVAFYADREIEMRPLGLSTPQAVGRNLDAAQRVLLEAEVAGGAVASCHRRLLQKAGLRENEK